MKEAGRPVCHLPPASPAPTSALASKAHLLGQLSTSRRACSSQSLQHHAVCTGWRRLHALQPSLCLVFNHWARLVQGP